MFMEKVQSRASEKAAFRSVYVVIFVHSWRKRRGARVHAGGHVGKT